MPKIDPRFLQLCIALVAFAPYSIWAQSESEKATITVEVADRAALEAALAELKIRGVIANSTIEYAPTRTSVPLVATDRAVAERALKKPDPVRIEVELTAVRYDADGRGVFTTSTGTVWRETVTSPTRSRLDPRRTYKGIITSGLMGGFRLNLEGVIRELKVEPIRTP